MELEFMKDVEPEMQQLYLERAAIQDRMLEAATGSTPDWEAEYEHLRRSLEQFDARIMAEHSSDLIAAMNDLYLAVLEIQMSLFTPGNPVPGLDRELQSNGRGSTTHEQFEQLSARARQAASRLQTFAGIPQRG
jgi:hypothetical protein